MNRQSWDAKGMQKKTGWFLAVGITKIVIIVLASLLAAVGIAVTKIIVADLSAQLTMKPA